MNRPLSAMREACETIVCPGEPCNWNRKCMEKCFREKKDAIQSCCTEECPDGFGHEECLEACNTELIYPEYEGPIQLSVKNPDFTLFRFLRAVLLVLFVLYLIGVFLGY